MQADSCYVIGSTHQVCQDYAISRCNIKSAINTDLIAVSDGCSSSLDTDFGSRFLIKSLENLYTCQELDPASSYFFQELNERTDSYVNKVSCLSTSCLDATLLFAYRTEKTIEVVMIGDGTVTIKAKDGMLFSKTVEYKGNAPLYLSYLDDTTSSNTRFKLRAAQFDCTKTVTESMHKNGVVLNSTKNKSLNDIERFSFYVSDISSITLFSDGISSFVQKKTDDYSRIPDHVVIEKMINYENHVPGHFHNIIKSLSKEDTINSDDFSAAALILE